MDAINEMDNGRPAEGESATQVITQDTPPDFLLPKFRTIEDQAKAYAEAERQMTAKAEEARRYKELLDLYNQNQQKAPAPQAPVQQAPQQPQGFRPTVSFFDDPDKYNAEHDAFIINQVNQVIGQAGQAIEYRVNSNMVIRDFLKDHKDMQTEENQAILSHYARVIDPNFQMIPEKRLEEAYKRASEYIGGLRESGRTTTPPSSGIPASRGVPSTPVNLPTTPKTSKAEEWVQFRLEQQQRCGRVDDLRQTKK
jgi:hypothetical protein